MFRECTALEKVTIASSVKKIGDYAFSGCKKLALVEFLGNAPATFGNRVFENCASSFKINYLSNKLGWSTPLWNDYAAYPVSYIATTTQTTTQITTEKTTEVTTSSIPNNIEGWIFDADLYRAKNPDLAAIYGNDDYGLYQHWLNCGIREGRIGSYVFDPGYYSEKYADLRAAFNNDYMEFYKHFLNYGINELRQASWQYNGAVYKENYNFDGWSGEELIWHYTHYGRAEGRQATGITYKDTFFNADYYRANNPDVVAYYGENVTDEQLYYHWCYNGVNEGRSGSPVYNEDYYIANNLDVGEAYTTHLDRYNHFFERGSAEGRAASAEFNLARYKSNNTDLVAAFGDYNKAYYEHYANYGYSEGRIAK
jgi:hypothetical protein